MRKTVEIGFRQLKVSCIIGVLDHEREKEQEIYLTLKAVCTFPEGDVIENAVDYACMAALASEVAKKGKFRLLESLASAVLDQIFKDRRVSEARLLVEKPAAIFDAASAFAELRRSR